MDHGPCAARRQDTCRSSTLSMADVNKVSLKVPRKTLKAITLETGEPVDAQPGFHQSHCPENDLFRDVRDDHGGELTK